MDAQSALSLILSGDPTLYSVVWLSLLVTVSATLFAGLVGLPLGAVVALTRFPGRNATIVVLNGLMGLPPVVVGLLAYLALYPAAHAREKLAALLWGDAPDKQARTSFCVALSAIRNRLVWLPFASNSNVV